MKRQLSAPSYISPPSPETVLRSIVWLEGMDVDIIDYIASLAEEKLFDSGDMIVKQGDQADGVYLIISGLVKVPFNDVQNNTKLNFGKSSFAKPLSLELEYTK